MRLKTSFTLPDDAAACWERYVLLEGCSARGMLMDALAQFIDTMLAMEEGTRTAWAFSIAEGMADHGEELPMRFPLFQWILFPALEAGVIAKRSGCARWLAHFGGMLHQIRTTSLPEECRTTPSLLREALRIDPDDMRARAGLVSCESDYLRYTIHELPAGVLYGMNGATIDQCDELLERLDDFRANVKLLSQDERYAELIDSCERHYRLYREYLAEGLRGGFEAFLERRAE